VIEMPLETGEVVSMAHAAVTRELTSQECRAFLGLDVTDLEKDGQETC
jgi:hypothetical protein